MFNETVADYPFEDLMEDTLANSWYEFEFLETEDNKSRLEAIQNDPVYLNKTENTYNTSPTSQQNSSNSANAAFFVEDLLKNESSDNFIDIAFKFEANDYESNLYFDDEPSNRLEIHSNITIKKVSSDNTLQKQDAHKKSSSNVRETCSQTQIEETSSANSNEINAAIAKKQNYVDPVQLQVSTSESSELELAGSSQSTDKYMKDDKKFYSFLASDSMQMAPKHSPKTTIISKVISIICDTLYTNRVQNAISHAMPNIKTLQTLIPKEFMPCDLVPLMLEDYIQSYGMFVLPNGYALRHFDSMQQVDGWIYIKNTRQNLDRLPLRLMNHKCNFYEPVVKRCRTEEGRIVREALCPYCPVDFNNLNKCFFNTDGCSYQHHVSRNHGVWNRGYEMPPPLIFAVDTTEKDHVAICPMCEKRSGIFKLTKTKEHQPGKAVYNSFISFHKHLVTEHNIKKKSRTKQQEHMDRRWFIEGFDYSSLTFEA